MTIVYKPTTKYSKSNDTAIEKQNLISGLMFYGTRITRYKSITSAGGTAFDTIYTVPEGKTFFLISAGLTIRIEPSTDAAGVSIIYHSGGTSSISRILYHEADVSTLGVGQISASSIVMPFSIPIRFLSGESILVSAFPTDCSSYATIIGYEIDSSLLKLFY